MLDGKCYPELDGYPVMNLLTRLQLKKIDLCGCIIAGGAIRDLLDDQKINDIDIFGTLEDIDRFTVTNGKLIISSTKSPIGHLNLVLEGCEYPVQLIKTECASSVLELLADFDIRMCRFAYDGINLSCDNRAFDDLKNKCIVIASFHTPYLTLTRLYKYIKRGFSIERKRYETLLQCLREMPEKQYQIEKKLLYDCDYGAFNKEKL